MTNYDKIISSVKETIEIESKAIAKLTEFIDSQFAEAVTYIYNSNGRVIITGIGKSANIAQKIVATLNSTGTPAIFMHAADAIHGDLGIIQENDVVICISKSGNTPEIKVLVPLIKNTNNKVSLVLSSKYAGIIATYCKMINICWWFKFADKFANMRKSLN